MLCFRSARTDHRPCRTHWDPRGKIMRRMRILVLFVLTAALAGCIQMESDVVLNKDGTGTCKIHYAMSIEVEDAMREMMAMNSDMTEDMGDMQLFDENFDLGAMKKEMEPLGVRIENYSSVKEDGKRVATLDFSFESAEGLQAVMQIAGGGQGAMGIRRLEDGNYALMKVEPLASMNDEEEKVEIDPQDMEDISAAMENAGRSMELMGALMASIDEMSIISRISFPGEIIQQNAHKVEGNTCIWEFNSDNMMQMQGMAEPYIVFSGKGLSLDVPDE